MQPDTNGAELLDSVRDFLRRFVAFPSQAALDAVTLWAAMTYFAVYLYAAPRLALLSPEPGSGKTRVLEVLALLTRRPMLAVSASPATIFRTLTIEMRTLLFDEVDAIWTKRGKDSDSNEDLRALLNSGYKRGAVIPRCVGPRHEVQNFVVYSPAALAGLGDLPDTLMSRSIIVRMRKRLRSEPVEPFRSRVHEPQALPVAQQLEEWAEQVGEEVGNAWPELPPGVVDRPAELWEPLIAVADAAGGHWPATARAACVELLKVAEDREVSLGVRLLVDLRTVFSDSDAMTTADILEALQGLEEAPWGDLYGKPLQARGLARMLRQYEVKSTKVKVAGKSLQGYRREDMWEAWERYAPPPTSPAEVEPPEPSDAAPRNSVPDGILKVPDNGAVHSQVPEPVEPAHRSEVPQVPVTAGTSEQEDPAATGNLMEVPEVPDAQEAGRSPAAPPPEVKRLHTLWRAGKRWPPEEQEDLDRIFNQPRATADDQRRLIDIAARLNTPPPGAPT